MPLAFLPSLAGRQEGRAISRFVTDPRDLSGIRFLLAFRPFVAAALSDRPLPCVAKKTATTAAETDRTDGRTTLVVLSLPPSLPPSLLWPLMPALLKFSFRLDRMCGRKKLVSRAYPDEMPIDDTKEQSLRVAREALDIACVSPISGLHMASWQELTHHPSPLSQKPFFKVKFHCPKPRNL